MKLLQTKREKAQVRQELHDNRTIEAQLSLISQRRGSSNKESLRIIQMGMTSGGMNKTFKELRIKQTK